jgi:hypothetical protein
MLDVIIEPDFDLRYFSYNSKWSASEAMASFRNGSGNAYFLLSNEQGASLLAQTPHSAVGRQVHERGSPMSGTIDGLPDGFSDALNEAAFSVAETTLCLWRRTEDETWSVGGEVRSDENGSADILFGLDGRPETYKDWADEYYGVNLLLEVIQQVYEALPLTTEMVQALNQRAHTV